MQSTEIPILGFCMFLHYVDVDFVNARWGRGEFATPNTIVWLMLCIDVFGF